MLNQINTNIVATALTDSNLGKNVIVFKFHRVHKLILTKKNILILGEIALQGLNDTILTAEAKYPINFTQSGKRFY